MRLNPELTCDVLVIGAGIAGIRAALAAAGEGRDVLLACRGAVFSGSSFYPGTWGLGLIGPALNEAGNSSGGIELLTRLADELDLSIL